MKSSHKRDSHGAATAPELAILGAPPAFAEKRHVGRPNIGDRQALLARINDLLDRRWLTNQGRYVQEFEARLAQIGRAHV